ncbi:hypothetical protein D9756_003602 [Leucocoprinus leucothites]|uniref:SMODS and SLOG-associating 2TM effector domain-containing protein n=1 Tax=Leucocoprinus leucothites TaxID=201217 RepID=A0A8H5LIW1_9AGAR|nr:hypothetical protein D9756_003602 [Leucoagaricus leucothites]
MDRPDPSLQVPASTSAASSAAPNTSGTTQAPVARSAGDSENSSAPDSPSEASTVRPNVPDAQGAGAPQQSPEQSTSRRPILQHGTTREFSLSPASSLARHVSEPAVGPARPTTSSTLGGPGTSSDRPPPTGAQLTPGHLTAEPVASGIGARPTTGSTLGGPGPSELQRPPNPPTPPPRPPLPQLRMGRSTSVGIVTPTAERHDDAETLSGLGHHELGRDSGVRLDRMLPILPSQARLPDNGGPRRQRTIDGQGSVVAPGLGRTRSGIDWAVPTTVEELKRKRTVAERLDPTIQNAERECAKYRAKAKMSGWALNAAIGLQVLLGSITTGLSAVATTGRSTAVQTTIFGALSTVVASYLARARGSNEPELSIARVKDLEHFLREANAFRLDRGHVDTDDWDQDIDHFRKRLEELLGNASGERKMATPV